jgi:hypothetical protein
LQLWSNQSIFIRQQKGVSVFPCNYVGVDFMNFLLLLKLEKMELKVVRSVHNPKSTLGKMYLNNEFYAFTCEDTVRNLKGDPGKKIKNETAIDAGRYEVVLSFSQRFQKYLPLLLKVPCFDGIRIHGGNTAADSEGCILIGAEGDMKASIRNCASKVASLVASLKAVEKKEKTWIEIVEE